MVNSLRTADVSARSSLLRDVSQRPSAAMNDEKRLPFAGYTTRLVFGVLLAREQAPHWGWGGGGGGWRKKTRRAKRAENCSLGRERVVEPGDIPLMPQTLQQFTMSRRQVFTDVSVSLLCRFCEDIWIRDLVRVQAKRSTIFDRQLD